MNGPLQPWSGRMSELIGRRVLVDVGHGIEAGIARRIQTGGDEHFLAVDLDRRPTIPVYVPVERIIGPEKAVSLAGLPFVHEPGCPGHAHVMETCAEARRDP
jgi:hypothetical protein